MAKTPEEIQILRTERFLRAEKDDYMCYAEPTPPAPIAAQTEKCELCHRALPHDVRTCADNQQKAEQVDAARLLNDFLGEERCRTLKTPRWFELRDEILNHLAASLKQETQPPRHGIYMASKTKHAAKWKALRASGVPIICTWIDESGIGETKSFPDLWRRCIGEAKSAERLIVYAEDGDELKGALVEVGAALAGGTPVFVVGKVEPLKTARNHVLVTEVATLEEALSGAASSPLKTPAAKIACVDPTRCELLQACMTAGHCPHPDLDKAKKWIPAPAPADTGAAGHIFCGMCNDSGLQNGQKCPQHGCRKANKLPPFDHFLDITKMVGKEGKVTGDTPQPQRQKEVIERLCKLASWVGDNVFENMEAYDCFCKNTTHPSNYRFSEEVLQYIENKVKGKTPDAGEEKEK